MRGIALAPSILAADFTRLGEQLAEVQQSGLADRIHVDVMDGQFVPTISFGPLICSAARRATTLPLEAHLMVLQPARFYDELAGIGVAGITIQVEACPHLHRDVSAIRALGLRAGVALNPGTPVAAIEAVFDLVDQVLVMSVNPGWGGQPFLPGTVARVARVREMTRARDIEIEVDGGIGPETARRVVDVGASALVAGSSVFGHKRGIGAGLAALHDSLAQGGS